MVKGLTHHITKDWPYFVNSQIIPNIILSIFLIMGSYSGCKTNGDMRQCAHFKFGHEINNLFFFYISNYWWHITKHFHPCLESPLWAEVCLHEDRSRTFQLWQTGTDWARLVSSSSSVDHHIVTIDWQFVVSRCRMLFCRKRAD